MATDEIVRPLSARAPSTAFSLSQYRLVVASSSEGYFAAGSTKSAGTIQPVLGVLYDAPTVTGEASKIAGIGSIAKIKSDSTALTPGSFFVMGGSGFASSTSNAVAQDLVFGPVLGAAVSSSSGVQTVMLNIVGLTT